MKKLSILLTALLGLGAALPSTALAGRGDHRGDHRGDRPRSHHSHGHGHRERTRVICDRHGREIVQVYTYVGRSSCGDPIFRWVTVSRSGGDHHHRGGAEFSFRIGR